MNDQTAQTTIIGADTTIKGEISFEGTARILGRIEGKVTSRGELQIGDGAHCVAALEASRVIIDGQVDGDVSARERIQLNSNANVVGDITAGTLIVAEGASLTGHCRIGPEASKSLAGEPVQASAPVEPVVRTLGRNGNRNGSAAAPPAGSSHEAISAAFAGIEAKFASIGRGRQPEVNAGS